MRILVLSNYYPPHHVGGYELGCRDVVGQLQMRGHEVFVLTSTGGASDSRDESGVFRELEIPREGGMNLTFPLKTLAAERHNGRSLRGLLRRHRFDLVYIWNLTGFSHQLLTCFVKHSLPISFFISDEWLARWRIGDPLSAWCLRRSDTSLKAFGKLPIRWLAAWAGYPPHTPPPIATAQFASDFLLRRTVSAGIAIAQPRVIHWGVDLTRFLFKGGRRGEGIRLLYAGQLLGHKGVITAIEALVRLKIRRPSLSLELTICGGSTDPAYLHSLKQAVREGRVEESTTFAGMQARENLPAIYWEHDILIFPSIWEEPFAITPLEAMACGCVVVATNTGGSPEIFRHEENALIFPPGDAEACTAQIERLIDEPQLYLRLQQKAEARIREDHSLEVMVQRIDDDLQRVAASFDPGQSEGS